MLLGGWGRSGDGKAGCGRGEEGVWSCRVKELMIVY